MVTWSSRRKKDQTPTFNAIASLLPFVHFQVVTTDQEGGDGEGRVKATQDDAKDQQLADAQVSLYLSQHAPKGRQQALKKKGKK